MSHDAPLVSVIIPTYNREETLGRAIRSILDQTYCNFELIVVDDGSTDSTDAVLEEFAGLLKVVTCRNRGVSAARNAGIAESSGELTAFLDSDDEWLPDKLAAQISRHKERLDFICHTDEIWIRNGKPVPQKARHRKQGGFFFERALELCLISPSSVVLSRRLLDEAGWFDESLPAAEDYDLWLRLTAFHEVDFIPEPLVIKHGGRPDQLSTTTAVIDRFRIRAIEKILSDQRLPPHYREAAGRMLIRKCEIVAGGLGKRGKQTEAVYYLELAQSYKTGDSGAP